MEERSLVITSRAILEPESIKDYILSEWGIQGLTNFQERLFEVLRFIRKNPGSCQIWTHSPNTYKTLIHHKTLVLFSYDETTVRVKAFYDGRIDLFKK